jgi:hypothetical protein
MNDRWSSIEPHRMPDEEEPGEEEDDPDRPEEEEAECPEAA